MLRALLPFFAASLLLAVEAPPEVKPVLAKLDAGLAEAERDWHLAQAKLKEEALKELDKMLKAERKKKASTLAIDLEARIQALGREAALLRDEPLLQANRIEEKLRTKSFTVEDWDAIPVPVLTLESRESRTAAKIKVAAGDLYLIAPHPTDVWRAHPEMEKVDFRGDKEGHMRMLVRCGEKEVDGFFVSETGPLTIGPKDDKCGDNLGSIRVKIIRVH